MSKKNKFRKPIEDDPTLSDTNMGRLLEAAFAKKEKREKQKHVAVAAAEEETLETPTSTPLDVSNQPTDVQPVERTPKASSIPPKKKETTDKPTKPFFVPKAVQARYQQMPVFKLIRKQGLHPQDIAVLHSLAYELHKTHPDLSAENLLKNQIALYLFCRNQFRPFYKGNKPSQEQLDEIKQKIQNKSEELVKNPLINKLYEQKSDTIDEKMTIVLYTNNTENSPYEDTDEFLSSAEILESIFKEADRIRAEKIAKIKEEKKKEKEKKKKTKKQSMVTISQDTHIQTKPLIEEHKDVPAEEEHKDVPTKEEHKDVPAEEEHKDVPTKEEHKDVPTKEEHKDVPAEEEHKDVPTKEEHKDVPAEEEHKDVPAEEEHKDVPAEEHTEKADDGFKTSWREFTNDVAKKFEESNVVEDEGKDFVAHVNHKAGQVSIAASSADNVALSAKDTDGKATIPDLKVFMVLAEKAANDGCAINFGDIRDNEFKARLLIACKEKKVKPIREPKIDDEFLNSIDKETKTRLSALLNKEEHRETLQNTAPAPEQQTQDQKKGDQKAPEAPSSAQVAASRFRMIKEVTH